MPAEQRIDRLEDEVKLLKAENARVVQMCIERGDALIKANTRVMLLRGALEAVSRLDYLREHNALALKVSAALKETQ